MLNTNEKMTVKPGLEKEWEEAVKKNRDAYGHGVVLATAAVGALLDAGKGIEEAHNACYKHGLTGFMAGCMAQWIAYFHPRGDEFRRWWNLRYQLGTEGEKANEGDGTLNPAILNLG